MLKALLPVAVLSLACVSPKAALPRSLEQVRERGALHVCAHPNALPFSSKAGQPPGFQIELAGALAKQMGVGLVTDWVITIYQLRGADCDIAMDVIADRQAQDETGLKYSKPYYRSGAVLVVTPDSKITSFATLDLHTKVGVQVGSMAAMVLNQRHVGTSTFGFEVDALEALANREVDAATVTLAAAGYFNITHPGNAIRVVGLDDSAPNLSWNVAIGMRKPDEPLRTAINDALDRLRADGTVAAIYQRYGIALPDPNVGEN